jgi:hypothetical protein
MVYIKKIFFFIQFFICAILKYSIGCNNSALEINIYIDGTAYLTGAILGFNQIELNSKVAESKLDRSGSLEYRFFWSQELNEELRRACGKKLYEEICKLKAKEERALSITIFGQSHGGNIAAEAVRYAQEKKDTNFYIDNMVFLETPIYKITEEAIGLKNTQNNYIIKKVYNIVAGKDYTQVIDVLTSHFPFCKRMFINNERKDIINITSDASNHCDLNAMVSSYKKIRNHINFDLDQHSKETFNRFSLQGGWLIWHDYGKKITYSAFSIIVFMLIYYKFIVDHKDKIKKNIYYCIDSIKKFFDFT